MVVRALRQLSGAAGIKVRGRIHRLPTGRGLEVTIRRGPFTQGDSNMEKRQMGKTDMHVSVLGFGGAEIGFEGATPQIVRQLLQDALALALPKADWGCNAGYRGVRPLTA